MTPTISHRTLADRLHEGKLPVGEALHFAMKLADALRRIHDAGHTYGALTPSNILFNGNTVELAGSPEHFSGVTPYTAPEVLHGKQADARSDIFAFGTVLFEMLTGRRAFDGDNDSALAAAIAESPAPSSGSPLVDRLVASCVAKDPAVRCQRMQKIIMELKLLSVAARRAEAPAPNRGQAEAQLRAEMQEAEARISARIASHESATARMQEDHQRALEELRQQHERSLAEAQQAAGEAVNSLRAQLDEAHARIAEAHARIGETQERMDQPIAEVRAMGDQLAARVENSIDPLGQRIADMEESLQDLRNRSAALQDNISSDLNGIEQALAAHSTAIDSARTAMAQTDDLVERVVEALELLQTSVLDQHEDRAALID